tara:strand:- start:782 stop:1981 length:1200 start_codon:yes stop_codon:yes gene_type:complete
MNLRKYWRIKFDGDKKYINSFADITISESSDFTVELESTDRYSMKDFIEAANKNLSSGQIKDLTGINFLYRYPGISLSRDRVGLYCEKTGLKMIRNKHAADARVISTKIIEKCVTSGYYENKFITGQQLINAVKKNATAFANAESKENVILGLEKFFTDKLDALVAVPDRYYYNTEWDKTVEVLCKELNSVSFSKNYAYKVAAKNENWFYEIMGGKFKWILDDDCNQAMSDISVPIEDKMFLQLKQMLKGGGSDDVAVAMTMMANAKIEGSETYLGMIFFHFGERMKGTKVWNQVGFKSLRQKFQKYYDNTNYQHGTSHRYERLIELLIQDDALTVPAMEHVLDLLFDRVIQSATGLGSSKAFKLERSSISLTPDFRAKVKRKSLSEVIKSEPVNDLPF